jgi:predicted Rdx family selenoprotein
VQVQRHGVAARHGQQCALLVAAGWGVEGAGEAFAQAIETVASRPGEFWSAAWPMVNLALWGEVFA